jgi:DNA excision repair protein ERCC-1
MDDDFGDEPDFSSFIRGVETSNSSTSGAALAVEPIPARIQQPKPQALPTRTGPSAILVSARQKGNPILSHIRLLPWEYADIPSDYVVGNTTCALFLSLKYHRLHPEYIYSRIRSLGGKYNLRILLTLVDIPNHEDSLKELSKTSMVNNLTLILCWSAPEAAHYLELFKSSENAQPTAIRSQRAQSYEESLVEFVTVPRSINKSDAASLISTFGSLQAAINAQPEQISSIPGWGEKKVRQWCEAVREEFRLPHAAMRGANQDRDLSARTAIRVYDPPQEPDDVQLNVGSEHPTTGTVTKPSSLYSGYNAQTQDEHRLAANLGVPNPTSNKPGTDEETAFGLDKGRPGDAPSTEDHSTSPPQPKPSDQPESAHEGIMAALAKLRDRHG